MLTLLSPIFWPSCARSRQARPFSAPATGYPTTVPLPLRSASTTTSECSPLAIDQYSVDTCSRRRSPTRPDPTQWIILLRKPTFFDWSFSSAAASISNLIRANVFPGDGIGPHIVESVKQHLAPESQRVVQFLEDRRDFGLPGIFHLLEAPWGE
ncbi:GTP-sensing transcriptional pleiotropic repressorCodY [Striga asiatica]|uniref:GTP-sensing transcriptional pleiotropic repressorCodY n=1 Tax=Striga asiatica TaxID=4170 RepID=A0A5A7PQT7_STRAF|nr:GTP-sensing transcriptional pleiotropic repressorCodY [Striga asiatica]